MRMVGRVVMVPLAVTASAVDFLSVEAIVPIASHAVALNCAASVDPLRFDSFDLAVAAMIAKRHPVDCLVVSDRAAERIVGLVRNHLREIRPSVLAHVAVDMVVGNSMAFVAFGAVASSFVVVS